MTIHKTSDLEQFIFRPDNRAKIIASHVDALVESIRGHNLLHMRPIDVNTDKEILDGQHRVLAAKRLGLEIYYRMSEDLEPRDILALNVHANWQNLDYMNYYIKQGNQEYIKLQSYMTANAIPLKIALALTIGINQREQNRRFKEGEYVFQADSTSEHVDLCWNTIHFIVKMNGRSPYLHAAKFWIALIKLVNHENFNNEKWMVNLRKMVERFSIKTTTQDYLKLMMDVHNYRSQEKIDLLHKEF